MDGDSSDGEHEHPSGATAPVIMETGVGLKPQMDWIFAEVEKALPDIDFDLSDVSSDTEEPVIFHRHLKMSELDYDDEKDMDTSLSGESAADFFKTSAGMIQIPSVDKNNASITDSSTSLTFDNDLAALLSAQEDSEDGKENVSSWHDLEKIARQDKQLQQESLEKHSSSPRTTTTTATTTITPSDPPPPEPNHQEEERRISNQGDNRIHTDNSSNVNRQMGILEAGDLVLSQLMENNRAAGSSIFGGRTADRDIIPRRKAENAGTSMEVEEEEEENRHSINENDWSLTSGKSRAGKKGKGEDSNKEAEQARQDRAAKEQKKKEEREELRRKEKELALTYMSAKAPHLSMQILDAIDLDSSLETENELANWTPHAALQARLAQRSASRATSTASTSAAAALAPSTQPPSTSETENLTLIQKLARFSLQQAGKDYNPTAIHPQTGASVASDASITAIAATGTLTASPPVPPAVTRPGPKAEPAVEHKAGVNVTNSAMTSTSPVGVSTASATVARPKKQEGASGGSNAPMSAMDALLETLSKRKPEPKTVYLDLRGFEQHKKEEEERMASVSRVLGLQQEGPAQNEESSESEDEEDKWIKQRQQMKRTLASRPATTPSFKQQRLKQAQPTRVINLQKTTSSRGVSTSSCGVSARLGTPGEAGRTEVASGDSNRLKEEEQAALRAREQEKERQKEAARVAREEQEKIRSGRLRMMHHLESMCSTGAVSESKPCAENTPVLFDLEASYEPRPLVLPTTLDKEELLLATVNLSSNGEIALHGSRSSKASTENVSNMNYQSLICWLVSLIPQNFNQVKRWLEHPGEAKQHYLETFPPFHVVGLQQVLVDGGLCLAITLCPSPVYMLQKDDRRDRHLKKGKKGEETTLFYKFVDTFLSRNSLSTVECWPQFLGKDGTEEGADLREYGVPLSFPSCRQLPFLSKPMSAYMQLHKDAGAVDSIFNKDVGFFWQTVDSEENVYQHGWKEVGGENTPQNTLFLLSKQALFSPQVVNETFNRVVSQSLDVCGLRVLYPSSSSSASSSEQSSSASAKNPSSAAAEVSLEGVTPVLAVAVRGPHARLRLVSTVGPMDYSLARRTDPYSLTAIFGNAKSGLQIFCPRNPDRARAELVRWFGGRVPPGAGAFDVGLPYKLKDLDGGAGGGGGGGVSGGAGKGKKGRKGSGGVGELSLDVKLSRPPAALTATTLSHVVMVISPIVPIWVLGFLVSLMQQKAAFQPRGIRRLCLSVKKAVSLGIPSASHALFCPGVNLEEADIDSGKQQLESCYPCTLLILERENASHHSSSLVQILASDLKNEKVMERIEDRTMNKFALSDLFHTADYSDTLITSLGGGFSRCPNFDPVCDVRGPLQTVQSNKELEQVVVLILLGKDLIKDWGSFLHKLQTFTTTCSRLGDFELLGVKWLPGMNGFQTREVTPYEIGDIRWRSSVHFLAKEPAVVFAMRGVNAFKKLEPFVSLPVNTSTTTIPSSGNPSRLTPRDAPHPTRLMSRNAKESYMFLRLFFSMHELFPDPDSRTLLPCLPESRLYYDTLEWAELGNVEGSKPKILLKTLEEQDLTQENIPELVLCEAIPLTTFLLVKPCAARKFLAKILRRLLQEGFSVVGLRMELMDRQLAQRFLALDFQNAGEMHDLHLDYLTSEPCVYLALCRENAVKKLCDILGPENPQQSRRQSQFYLRGIYGTDEMHNGLYASRTYIESVWDQRNFFPDGLCCEPTYDLEMEKILCPAMDSLMEGALNHTRHAVRSTHCRQDRPGAAQISATEQKVHTLLMQTTCLVLPPALVVSKKGSKEAPFVDILTLLLGRGFELAGARMMWMDQHQAGQCLHILHSGTYENVSQLSSGPSLILALDRDNAVMAFESTVGTSEEAQTFLSQYSKHMYRPADCKQADQLLSLFFDTLMPGSHTEIQPLLPSQQAPASTS